MPSDITAIRISATGGGGGSSKNGCAPGKGGTVEATFSVTPGSALAITVAGQGGRTTTETGGSGGVGGGGSGGTGAGGQGGGAGGGASSAALAGNPLLVGAGGGGCGAFAASPVSDGGDDGADGRNGSTATGGTPGTQTAGGMGGASANGADPDGADGTQGQGGSGAGVAPQDGGGGGGGGGYFGGGGGGGVRSLELRAGGGAGGSDFVAVAGSTVAVSPGANAGNGQVTISYPTVTAPVISGKTEVRSTLTASPGAGTDVGTATYQWLRGNSASFSPIPGATGSTYKLGKFDRGKRVELTAAVITSNGTASARSKPTEVVGPPLVSSSARRTQRAVKKHGVVVKVKSNLRGTVTATGTIALPKGIAKTLRFNRVKRSLAAGKTRTLRLRLSKTAFARLRRVLVGKRRLKARLTLVVKDMLGGHASKRITVRLKR